MTDARLPSGSEHPDLNSIAKCQGAQRERQYAGGGGLVATIYRRCIRPHIGRELNRQRFKLLYDTWAYWKLLRLPALGIHERVRIVARMLAIDWNILHAHKPCEITAIIIELTQRRAVEGEAVIEAGCWNGGSTAKLSIACKLFGYRLHVYDSFQGVREWGFAYSAQQAAVAENLRRYGEPSVCTLHPGWFSETLLNRPLPFPVRLTYIDCDVAAGTREVLSAVLPSLAKHGAVYTQDYHIASVRELLHEPRTWAALGVRPPTIRYVIRNLARLTFQAAEAST
jgi:O-methyltransferase